MENEKEKNIDDEIKDENLDDSYEEEYDEEEYDEEEEVSDYTNKQNFQFIRNIMNRLAEKANNSQKDEDAFFDMFSFVIERAEGGDLAAQDFLSYAFKKGYGDLILVNYENAMDWEFMAGSNGNEFAIEKLKIFFAQSFDKVFSLEDCANILAKNGIYTHNYEYELGKLFCDAMVDELELNMEEMLSRKPVFSASTIVKAQKYERARAKSIDSVINYLKRA